MSNPKNVQKMTMSDFNVVKVIGEGAYGRAILCKAKSDNNQVVIKEIALSNLSAQEQREAWKETKVLSLLHHPNIISYKGSFMEKNKLHIVMDFADGGDLFEQIQKAKSNHFKEDQILEWFVQITLALKHIHDRKILHRDIKCQNIFLMKNGMIKMGDFGIAKILDHTTQLSKTAIGTPYYLSPEICQGKAYNNKSDVWSLGCVLYELCTLQHAFDSKCMNGLIMKILRSKQNPIPYFYSQNLRNLVDSLLQKQPNKRPTVNQILKLDFVRARIGNLLSETVQKMEFCHTVFHNVKGGETPANLMPPENMKPISEGNEKQRPPSGNKNIAPAPAAPASKPERPNSSEQQQKQQQQPQQQNVVKSALDKPKAAPLGRPPAQNEIPKPVQRPPPKMPKGLPVNKNPVKAAPVAKAAPPPVQVQVKAYKPKAPREIEKPAGKDEILARKNAAVLQERAMQKEAREKREREEKEAEEKAALKRAEILEKKAQRESERKAQMRHLQQEARDRKKKYDNLEAPFKKAMGGGGAPPPPPARAAPAAQAADPAPRGGDRPLPKYRETYDDDDLPPDAFDPNFDANAAPKREKPKLPEKQPTIRPDRIKNREEEQKNLREMMNKKRAELKAQKLAEKKAQQEMEAKLAALKAQEDAKPPQPAAAAAPQPSKPAPEPTKPAPTSSRPDPAPAKPAPAPAKPAPAPAKPAPAPAKPAPAPAKPAPAPAKPAPAPVKKEAPQPVKPAPAPEPVERQTRLEDLIVLSDSGSDSEEDDIISLVANLKNILDDPPTSDEDQEEEEEKEEDISSNPPGVFMFNGKELKLPMVTNNDSLHYRVEALRQFIEENLGIDKFIAVYRFITVESDSLTEEEGGNKVKNILNTSDDQSYYTLIQQLVFCEESQ